MKFLCENANQGSPVVFYIILAVMVVAMLIMPYFTNKKRNQQYMEMISNIKVGDLVKTAGGIIGRVTKITDKGEIKTIILETGAKSSKSTMEFDISSVYCVLQSTKVEEPKEEVKETPVVEEKKEAEVPAVEAEETPKKEVAKKTTAKKTTAKAGTKKTSTTKKSSK